MGSPIFLHEGWNEDEYHSGLPMMQMIVAPASMKHIWYMRGFIAMLGPATYEMEDIVKATLSFKISGRPYLSTIKDVKQTNLVVARMPPGDGDNAERVYQWYAAGGLNENGIENYPAYWLEDWNP